MSSSPRPLPKLSLASESWGAFWWEARRPREECPLRSNHKDKACLHSWCVWITDIYQVLRLLENLQVSTDCQGDFKSPGAFRLLRVQMTGGFHSGHLWLYFVGLKRPALLSHYPLRWTAVSRLWWMTARLLFSLLWPPNMLVSLCLFPTHLTQNVSRMYRLPAGILYSWILRHSPSIFQRKVASWVCRVYGFIAVKRMRGSGGQKGLWGILLFAFNLELSAVAWETKPKKNIYHFFFFFCMHLQIFQSQDVLLGWEEALRLWRPSKVMFIICTPQLSIPRVLSITLLINQDMYMWETATEKVKLFFPVRRSEEASESRREEAAMQSEDLFLEHGSNRQLRLCTWAVCHK